MKLKVDIDFDKIKYPLLILYKENEGKWLPSLRREHNKTYSDVFDVDDIRHHFSSIVFISDTPSEIKYIASFRRGTIVATRKVRVSFDIIFELEKPLTFDFITKYSTKAMADHVEIAFSDNNNLCYLNKYQIKTIILSLYQLNENNIKIIKRILFNNRKIKDNNKSFIRSTERDVLGTILRINGLEDEKNDIIGWDIENISTPEFLKNLKTINVREDSLIIKDSRIFGNWKLINDDVHGVCTLSNSTNCVSIIYANRGKTESNIGVDLIYFDHNNRSYIFVQYKRLTDKNGRYVYYPSSDDNLSKELNLMEQLELNLLKNKNDYRFNDQVFYFKFCKEKQDVYSKDLSKGFYMPKDYFLLYSKLQKENGNSVVISYNTIKRYLTNTSFIDLIKSGLIGTRIDDANFITRIIEESLSNNKSLILAASEKITGSN